MAERGVQVSCETVRRWVKRFGPPIARGLRLGRPRDAAARQFILLGVVRDATEFVTKPLQIVLWPEAATRADAMKLILFSQQKTLDLSARGFRE